MRIIAKYEKTGAAKYVSHLDMLRLFQRAFRRAELPLAFSQGFNPHPLMSFATALSLGTTSSGEWLDFKLESDLPPDEVRERANAALPDGVKLVQTFAADESMKSLSALMDGALYEIAFDDMVEPERLRQAIDELLSGEIIVTRRSKAGMKQADLRPQIRYMRVGDDGRISLLGECNAAGGLNVELLMKELCLKLGCEPEYRVHRSALYFQGDERLPKGD